MGTVNESKRLVVVVYVGFRKDDVLKSALVQATKKKSCTYFISPTDKQSADD